jgi:hypothetical protein
VIFCISWELWKDNKPSISFIPPHIFLLAKVQTESLSLKDFTATGTSKKCILFHMHIPEQQNCEINPDNKWL